MYTDSAIKIFTEVVIIAITLVVMFMLFISYKSLRRPKRHVSDHGSSVLFAYYTQGTKIIPLGKGKIRKMNFYAFSAFGGEGYIEGSQAILYQFALNFKTKIHLLAIPKKGGTIKLDTAVGDATMEVVDLEGDYRDYFTLYCEKGMQTEARYVLDPAAMAFTIDFCQAYNWEIVGDEMYFVQTAKTESNMDSPDMQLDILKFIDQIRPALEQPLSEEEEQLRAPYGQDNRQDLKCPICADLLINKENYFECPNHDGILLTGANLNKLRSGKLIIAPKQNQKPLPSHGVITCPSCGSKMHPIPFVGSKTTIDSCTNCPYRWLDGGEDNQILRSIRWLENYPANGS